MAAILRALGARAGTGDYARVNTLFGAKSGREKVLN
jgi:hypothetical protein